MVRKVGSWWIKDGVDERREEAQGLARVLDALPSFQWSQDRGDNEVVRKDFVETAAYTEKVDTVDILYMSSHGSYDEDDASTWGHAFSVWNNVVRASDSCDWGKSTLEYFASHACKLLYHSASNTVGRWIAAFERLHHMLGFHTVSHSGKDQDERGEKFGSYAAMHLFFPPGLPVSKTAIRTAWKQACCETEPSSVSWAYLRANGRPAAGGSWVNTYNETLENAEPDDPIVEREFWRNKGSC